MTGQTLHPAPSEPVRFTAVVMAGRRSGGDPLAQAHGHTHKCFIEIGGTPMLARVLDALDGCGQIGAVVLCIDRAVDDIEFLQRRIAQGTLTLSAPAASPAASAARVCHELAGRFPVLVLTGDHPLLEPEMLGYFCTHARGNGDVVAAVALAKMVSEAYPGVARTHLRFKDGPYCGCNLFAFNRPAAIAAANYWKSIEEQRKSPWRIVRALGVYTLIRYITGRLTLGAALQLLSDRIGVNAGAVVMPYANAAIDVDKEDDLHLARRILDPAQRSET